MMKQHEEARKPTPCPTCGQDWLCMPADFKPSAIQAERDSLKAQLAEVTLDLGARREICEEWRIRVNDMEDQLASTTEAHNKLLAINAKLVHTAQCALMAAPDGPAYGFARKMLYEAIAEAKKGASHE